MFGIGGSELIFIVFIAIMLFGADKIPEVARGLGKGIQQLKNATNDIKTEIHKNVSDTTGFDPNNLTNGLSDEVNKVKENFAKILENTQKETGIDEVANNLSKDATKVQEDIESLQGPIKRQL